MNHREFIKVHGEQLGQFRKAAEDTVVLLDHPCTQLALAQQAEQSQDTAIDRVRLIEELSAMAVAVGLAPVSLCLEDLLASLPGMDECNEESHLHIEEQVAQHAGHPELSALQIVLNRMPWILNACGLRGSTPLRAINHLLLTHGCEPIRPKHGDMKVPSATNQEPPTREVRVLIVDDVISEIVKTWSAIRGWPNLRLDALFADFVPGETEEVFVSRIAGEVIERTPDLVLMDGHFPLGSGPLVIGEIHARVTPQAMVFVGNTGGDPRGLNQAGAIGNANKGFQLDPIIRGLRSIR